MPNDFPDWYPRYRELTNRRDRLREEGTSLPPAEEAEWQRLDRQLQQFAENSAGLDPGPKPAPPQPPTPAGTPANPAPAPVPLAEPPPPRRGPSLEELRAAQAARDLSGEMEAAGLGSIPLAADAAEIWPTTPAYGLKEEPTHVPGDVIPLAPDAPPGETYNFAGGPPVGPPGGGKTGPGEPNEEDKRQTQYLDDIRKALRILTGQDQGGPAANARGAAGMTDYQRDWESYHAERERRREIGEREDLFAGAAEDMAPAGGSGRHLFDFGKRAFGIFRRTRDRIRPRLKPPNPKNYDRQGNRLGRRARRGNAPAAKASGKPPPAGGGAGTGAAAGGAAARGGATAAAAAAGAGGAGGGAAAGGAAAGAAGAGGAMAAAAGPVGWAVIFAAAVMEFGKATYAFARAQEAEIRRLAEYGGEQAMGTAVLDAHRTLRDVKTARETGASSRDLTQSLDKFEQALQPIEALLTNIANTVGSRLLDLMTQILQPVSDAAELFNRFYELFVKFYNACPWTKNITEETTNWDLMDRLAAESRIAEQPRFPGAPAGGPDPLVAAAGSFAGRFFGR